MIFVLILGPLAIGPACGPAEGDEGGQCIGRNGQCHEGLACDRSNTCVRAAPPAPSGPPTATCWVPESRSCGIALEVACDSPLTPSMFGYSSLGCAVLNDFGGVKDYCCAPPGTCFPPGQGCKVDEPGWRYFCTGTANPSVPGATCTLSEADDGGIGARVYCCLNDDAGLDDGGAGAEAGADSD